MRLVCLGLVCALASCGRYYRAGAGANVRNDGTAGVEASGSAGISLGGMGLYGAFATVAAYADGDARAIVGIEAGFSIAPLTLGKQGKYRNTTHDETRLRLFSGIGPGFDGEFRGVHHAGIGIDRMRVKHVRHKRKSFSSRNKYLSWGYSIDDWRATGLGLELLYRGDLGSDPHTFEMAARAVYTVERRRD